MGKKRRECTPKQKLFCERYFLTLDVRRSAREAKYSEKSADTIGYQLLRKPHVIRYLKKLVDGRTARTGIDADVILREILRLATSDIREVFDENGRMLPIKKIPKDAARAISGIEIEEIYGPGKGKDRKIIGHTKKIKFHGKNQAVRMAGEHLRLFAQVIEIDTDKWDQIARARERATRKK